MCQPGIQFVNCKASVEQSYVLTKESSFSVSNTTRPDSGSGNTNARAVKLGTVKDLVKSARKGFMTKLHRRPWCQD